MPLWLALSSTYRTRANGLVLMQNRQEETLQKKDQWQEVTLQPCSQAQALSQPLRLLKDKPMPNSLTTKTCHGQLLHMKTCGIVIQNSMRFCMLRSQPLQQISNHLKKSLARLKNGSETPKELILKICQTNLIGRTLKGQILSVKLMTKEGVAHATKLPICKCLKLDWESKKA
jgi:hypothetical protein